MEKVVSTLRDTVKHSKVCYERFRKAESLAKRIFTKTKGRVPLPFFTEHGREHCEMLEKYLDAIIWNKEEPHEHDFIPSPEEAMYLLSAVWLHDIGMWYGIFDNERPEDLVGETEKVIKLRDKHEFRASRYIHEKWMNQCMWLEEEKDWLANICVYHRRHHPIGTFDPFKTDGRHTEGYIHLAVLAALLRLADACHVDKTRAPRPVMDLYISLGMPQEAVCHWKRAELIREVNFDHVRRHIIITGHYPPKVSFDLGEFDLGEVGEIVCRNMREEMHSVQQVLLRYPNTSFWEIKHDAHYITALGHQQKRQCLALWPYLLNKPTSSTEAAAALVELLLLATDEAQESGNLGLRWRRNISQIMKKALSGRPFDFMIRNLCTVVRKILSTLPKKAKSAERLEKYLKGIMKTIVKNSDKMAGHALDVIATGDALLICGYSTNIEKVLRNLDTQHLIYVVDCYRPIGANLRFDENRRITKCAQELDFSEVRFIQMPSVVHALAELQRNGIRCKLLLGTHGVLKNGDLLCEVGSKMLATAAREFDAEVIAFAEEMKVLAKRISEKKITLSEKLFSSKEYKRHPEMDDIMYVEPKMDHVPRSLVDIVIMAKGPKKVAAIA